MNLFIGENREKYNNYILTKNISLLSDWPKPICVEGIPLDGLKQVLELANEQERKGIGGTISIYTKLEEATSIELATGSFGGGCFVRYNTLFGEVEELVKKEGSYFNGIDGRKEGAIKYKTLMPKTDIAVVCKDSSDFRSHKRKIYFLKQTSETNH